MANENKIGKKTNTIITAMVLIFMFIKVTGLFKTGIYLLENIYVIYVTLNFSPN